MPSVALADHRARYVAADTPDGFERERLDLLGRLMNPMTTGRLERLGVGRGWRCLEVGAGDGSVARWLAERVGPRGRVVATDINPRFLGDLGVAGVEVRRHDILHDDLETGHYDLVHCRALLMHLPEPERAVARMAAALRPGGWLLVEEGDLGTFATDHAHPAAAWFNRIHRRAAEIVHDCGLVDLYFGRRCRGLLERLGLTDVGDETTTWLCRGGGLGARFLQMGAELLWTLLPGNDAISADDCKELQYVYEDPSFTFVPLAMVGAWGRRAPWTS